MFKLITSNYFVNNYGFKVVVTDLINEAKGYLLADNMDIILNTAKFDLACG